MKKEQMIEKRLINLGKLQYTLNYLDGNSIENLTILSHKNGIVTVCFYSEEDNNTRYYKMEDWIFRFIMKNRSLKGGMKTSFQRRLLWNAISRKAAD